MYLQAVSGSNIRTFTDPLRLMPPSAAAKSLQSCPTLCDSIDGSPPGSTIPGLLQARTLECIAISVSNALMWKVKGKSLSRLFSTRWTAAHQAPPPMGFSRQEYWSGVRLPSLSIDIRHSLLLNHIFLPHCFYYILFSFEKLSYLIILIAHASFDFLWVQEAFPDPSNI